MRMHPPVQNYTFLLYTAAIERSTAIYSCNMSWQNSYCAIDSNSYSHLQHVLHEHNSHNRGSLKKHHRTVAFLAFGLSAPAVAKLSAHCGCTWQLPQHKPCPWPGHLQFSSFCKGCHSHSFLVSFLLSQLPPGSIAHHYKNSCLIDQSPKPDLPKQLVVGL